MSRRLVCYFLEERRNGGRRRLTYRCADSILTCAAHQQRIADGTSVARHAHSGRPLTRRSLGRHPQRQQARAFELDNAHALQADSDVSQNMGLLSIQVVPFELESKVQEVVTMFMVYVRSSPSNWSVADILRVPQ